MLADTAREPQSLGEILAAVARRASDGQLLIMTLVGFAGTAALVQILDRQGWLAAAGALAVGSYGAWGIADRELNERWSRPGAKGPVIIALRLGRAVAAVVATLAAVALAATMFIPFLGRWIS